MPSTSVITEKDFQTKLDKEKIENLIEDIIGKGNKYTYTITEKTNDAFHIDSLLFLEICFGNSKTISAVVKMMKKASSTKQFKNELFMYKSIIQNLSEDFQTMFPSLIYASPVSDSDNMVIALEDLSQVGFRMAPRRVKMSLDEIRISLTALGKFHAEMYSMKLRDPTKFSKATNFININQAYCEKNNDPLSLFTQSFRKQAVLKTFERLIRYNNDNSKIKTIYNFLQMNSLNELCLKFLEPEEPIAVICHGDYNRHNLMFRYENGLPVECKIIDLQTPSYGSPSIDIGFILFMNMESSDRLKHWNSLWHDYYDALQEGLRINMGDHFVIPPYLSIESLQNDFRRKSFYSFINSMCFTFFQFFDINGLFKFAGDYFEIDEADEDARIKHIQQFIELIETGEIVRINNELTLEYVELFGQDLLLLL